ncbi:MAG TPA: hypothetical protein VGC47_00515 [Acidimicrobiia bacterium]|jgi:predicted HAD superfamily phosphohydrolase YqeG
MSRVPRRSVHDLDEVVSVVAAVAASGDPVVLILDVDNTLAPQGSEPEEFGRLVNAAIDRLETIEAIDRLIVLSNGAQRGVPRMVSRGNKPWTTRRRLGLRGGDDTVIVVGDQVLTDGLLAWRLGASFLYLVIDDETESAPQAGMRRIGRWVTRLLFRPWPNR